jgi:hypothetical protein
MHTFNLEDIEKLATSSSFFRGIDYYKSERVGEITRSGTLFKTTVYGSTKYSVSLDIAGNELKFNCNCPYDFGGICKHKVALAMKILDSNYKSTNTDKPELNTEEFNTIFNETSREQKIEFLKRLLDNNIDIQYQFIEFIKDIPEISDSAIMKKIDKIKQKIYSQLAKLDFSNLEEQYYNSFDYDYGNDYWADDSGLYNYADDKIRDVFIPFIDQSVSFINKGNLIEAIIILLGIYEGANFLPEEDYNNLIYYDDDFIDNVPDILMDSIEKIESNLFDIVKSDKIILKVLDIIFNRINFYNKKDKRKRENGNENPYYIKDFEKIFDALIVNKITAEYLYSLLQKNELLTIESAYIILNIAEILEDDVLWIDTAESHFDYDIGIAKKLIEKYRAENREKDFNRIAEIVFNKWPNDFDFFLINNLNKKRQKSLYIRALKNYVRDKFNIRYYEILRKYLTDNEKILFVNSFSNNYNTLFYVQLLEMEKRYNDILLCAQKHKNSDNLDRLLAPILNRYPKDCFELIVNKNTAMLNYEGRGRRTYQMMMQTLKQLKQIPTMEKETTLFLNRLYNHRPNLPALRDEMQKAGLVNDAVKKK